MKNIVTLIILGLASSFVFGQQSPIPDPTTITLYAPTSLGINTTGIYAPPTPGYINVVILAEGYTASASDINGPVGFNTDANEFIAEFLITPPFDAYQSYFKFYKVFVASTESGSDHPNTAGTCGEPTGSYALATSSKTTAFNCSYDNSSYGPDGAVNTSHRLLKPTSDADIAAVNTYVQAHFPGTGTSPIISTTVILVNSQEYGGNGNRFMGADPNDHTQTHGIATGMAKFTTSTDVGGGATASLNVCNSNSGSYPNGACDERMTIHEFGHSFAHLLDEYWATSELVDGHYITGANKEYSTGTPSSWNHWYPAVSPYSADATIAYNNHYRFVDICVYPQVETSPGSGIYTNHYGTEEPYYYKPTTRTTGSVTNSAKCKMEDISKPFCSVCKEAIIEKIHDLVDPIVSVTPAINDVATPYTISSTPITFSLDLIEPTNPAFMEVLWYLDDVTTPFTTTAASPDWDWSLDCGNLNSIFPSLPEGPHTIKVVVFDKTGTATANHLVRKSTHSAHHYERTWHIVNPGLNENLMIRDFYNQMEVSAPITDAGAEPWQPFPLDGWYFDYTSDILYRNSITPGAITNFDSYSSDQIAVGTETEAYVYVRVKNIGCTAFTEAANLHLYASVHGSQTSWPSSWETNTSNFDGYEITASAATIPDLNPGEEGVVEIQWASIDWPHLAGTVQEVNPCLMARIEDVTNDPIHTQTNLTDWIRYNNNIAMKNLNVIHPLEEVVEIGGKPYQGSYTYMGNTKHVADTFDISLLYGLQQSGNKAITDEAEVIIYFKETGWDASAAIAAADSNLLKRGLVRLDSTLFVATHKNATFSRIIIPADTTIPVFIGVAFLTEALGDSANYVVHLEERRSSAKDTIFWAHHYQINRNPSRTLFTADAGANQNVVLGDTLTLTADNIGEAALYIWHNKSGAVVGTGQALCIVPDTTMDYKLEVIAEADGYKDYDQVNVKVSKGQITSVVPNPASTSTIVYYRTSSITTAKIKVVDVSTFTEIANFTVTAGTGSKTITVSGYTTGAYIITLEGDSHNLDSETLIIE